MWVFARKRCCPNSSLRMPSFKDSVATICVFLVCFGLVNNHLHLKKVAKNSSLNLNSSNLNWNSSGESGPVPQTSNFNATEDPNRGGGGGVGGIGSSGNAPTAIDDDDDDVPTERSGDDIVPTLLDGNDEVSRSIDATSATTSVRTNTMVWNNSTHKAILEQQQQQQQQQGTELFDRRNTIILVENETGYIDTNGQLIVDVNETYLFWNGGQEKLCNLLKNMTLAASLDETSTRSELLLPPPSAVLNVTMDCIDHNEHKQGLGQGNWVTAIYAARMAAFLAGVDFRFQCLDGQTSRMSLLLPWFDKYQTAAVTTTTPAMNGNTTTTTTTTSRWPHGGDRPTEKEACAPKYPFLRIDKMAHEIQDDLRKMAVSLVGTRDNIRRHPGVPFDATPLVPGVQLDDVALHFRCGDVLGGANRNDFGMIRFHEYKKWIPNTTERIGILTQPFEKARNRKLDSQKADSCRTVVYALVDYLQEFAPGATISIHNGSNETHPLAFARLVMANISITSLSSFGIFPVVGTFGRGYFQRGNRGINPFAAYIPSILPNTHVMDADVRGTGQMKGKSIENLVEWFVNDTTTTTN